MLYSFGRVINNFQWLLNIYSVFNHLTLTIKFTSESFLRVFLLLQHLSPLIFFLSCNQQANVFQGASLTFINQAFPALRMIITVHLFDQQKTAVKMQRRLCLKPVCSGHSSATVGAQEVNRCAPLALYRGFRYIQATHIQTLTQEEQRLWSSGPGQVFILQLPQRPLSPAALPACSALSSLEIHPSFTNSFSLYLEFTSHHFLFSSQILFITLLKLFPPNLNLSPPRLSHVHPRASSYASFQLSSSFCL